MTMLALLALYSVLCFLYGATGVSPSSVAEEELLLTELVLVAPLATYQPDGGGQVQQQQQARLSTFLSATHSRLYTEPLMALNESSTAYPLPVRVHLVFRILSGLHRLNKAVASASSADAITDILESHHSLSELSSTLYVFRSSAPSMPPSYISKTRRFAWFNIASGASPLLKVPAAEADEVQKLVYSAQLAAFIHRNARILLSPPMRLPPPMSLASTVLVQLLIVSEGDGQEKTMDERMLAVVQQYLSLVELPMQKLQVRVERVSRAACASCTSALQSASEARRRGANGAAVATAAAVALREDAMERPGQVRAIVLLDAAADAEMAVLGAERTCVMLSRPTAATATSLAGCVLEAGWGLLPLPRPWSDAPSFAGADAARRNLVISELLLLRSRLPLKSVEPVRKSLRFLEERDYANALSTLRAAHPPLASLLNEHYPHDASSAKGTPLEQECRTASFHCCYNVELLVLVLVTVSFSVASPFIVRLVLEPGHRRLH